MCWQGFGRGEDSGGVRAGTSARLLTGRAQVRFLPPELSGSGRPTERIAIQLEGQAHWRGPLSRKQPSRETGLGGSTPSPSAALRWFSPYVAFIALSPPIFRGRPSATPSGDGSPVRRVRVPHGAWMCSCYCAFGDRLTVGRPPLERSVEVRILLPDLSCFLDALAELVAGSPGCQPGGCGFDSRQGRSLEVWPVR
jgi:hypothetical protein